MKRKIATSLGLIFLVTSLIFLSIPQEAEAVSPSNPENLRINGELENYSYLNVTPKFSAKYLDDDGENADFVEIQVGTNSGDNDVWDSGWISVQDRGGGTLEDGEMSEYILYDGPNLYRTENYYWMIRFQDESGEKGLWSDEIATFNMAWAELSKSTANSGVMEPGDYYADLTHSSSSTSYMGTIYPEKAKKPQINGKPKYTEGENFPVDVTELKFSAIYEDDDLNYQGTHAQIKVWDNDTDTLLWDSVIDITDVSSGERCEEIQYQGDTVSGSSFWNIRFKNNYSGSENGEWGSWVENMTFNYLTADLTTRSTTSGEMDEPQTYADLASRTAITSMMKVLQCGKPENLEINGENAENTPELESVDGFSAEKGTSGDYQIDNVQVKVWDNTSNELLWDSGWVDIANIETGERTEQIPYDGPNHATMKFSMKFKNTENRISSWTENLDFILLFSDLTNDSKPSGIMQPPNAFGDISQNKALAGEYKSKFYPVNLEFENEWLGTDSAYFRCELSDVVNPDTSINNLQVLLEHWKIGGTVDQEFKKTEDNVVILYSEFPEENEDMKYRFTVQGTENVVEAISAEKTFRPNFVWSIRENWGNYVSYENNIEYRNGLISLPMTSFEEGVIPSRWAERGNGWETTTAENYSGEYAAVNSPTGDSENARMIARDYNTVFVKFRYKTSSEPDHDYLKFFVDGKLQAKFSGKMENWKSYSMRVGEGENDFEWRYIKDESGENGNDKAYVDLVNYATVDKGEYKSQWFYVASENRNLGTFKFEDVMVEPGSDVKFRVLTSTNAENISSVSEWTSLEEGTSHYDLSNLKGRFFKVSLEFFRGSTATVDEWEANLTSDVEGEPVEENDDWIEHWRDDDENGKSVWDNLDKPGLFGVPYGAIFSTILGIPIFLILFILMLIALYYEKRNYALGFFALMAFLVINFTAFMVQYIWELPITIGG